MPACVSSLNESIVEDAALTWFGELGYAVGHGPHLAPGEPAAERDSFGEVVLVGRLREAIRRLNPAIPEEAREEALRKVLRVGTPSLTQTNRAFHRMLRMVFLSNAFDPGTLTQLLSHWEGEPKRGEVRSLGKVCNIAAGLISPA